MFYLLTYLLSYLLTVPAAKFVFCEQVWGCGGTAAREGQQKQKAWEQRAVTKEQDRKVFIYDCFSHSK